MMNAIRADITVRTRFAGFVGVTSRRG